MSQMPIPKTERVSCPIWASRFYRELVHASSGPPADANGASCPGDRLLCCRAPVNGSGANLERHAGSIGSVLRNG